jgi:negative regulator of flagellin synthesis FlgM
MRVNSSVNPNVQGTQTETTKKSEQAAKTDRARQIEKMAKTQSGSPAGAAKAEISDKAKDLAKAHAVATAAPDVREDRIAEIKRRLNAGEYKIDSDAIADKMISEHAGM